MKTSAYVRLGAQLAFLVAMTWLGYRHQVLGGGPAGVPPVDAMCPFGGVESLFSFVQEGTWLRRVAPSALVLFAATALMTLLLGRVFCSWICPMGTLTDLSRKLGQKLGFRGVRVPVGLDRGLRWLKYVVLVVILALTWRTGTLVFRDYDPWMAWMHLTAGFSGAEVASVVLGGVLLAEWIVPRFWCRYLCPLGALFALGQRLAPVKPCRDPQTCINCGKCDRACPVGLHPAGSVLLRSAECLACGQCVEACPKKDALNFSFGLGTSQRIALPVLLVGGLGLVLFGGVYGMARLTGVWATTVKAENVQTGNPADKIFGWMNLRQVAETVGLPVEDVLRLTELPADTALDVSVKKLPGVNDDSFRATLRTYFEKTRQGNK